MAKGKKKDDQPSGAPLWMVTYGDLMSLLLTFFVLLLSFSVMEENKITQAITSVKRALNVLPKSDAVVQIMKSKQGKSSSTSRQLARLARELKRLMLIQGQAGTIKVEFDKQGGLKISLPNNVLFDLGRAELKPEAFGILRDIAALLLDVPEKFIEVRGHTDNLPLRSTVRR